MKKNHVLLFTLVSVFALNAQTTANFTTAENYVDGPLEGSDNWDDSSSGFTVDVTNEKVSTSVGGADALWIEQLTNIGSTVSFEVNLNFSGDCSFENFCMYLNISTKKLKKIQLILNYEKISLFSSFLHVDTKYVCPNTH